MSALKPTEKRFEEYIEKRLQSAGYISEDATEYDRDLCLLPKQVIEFIRVTQPEQWDELTEIHGDDTEDKVLSRISSEISTRGAIDVLRGEVIDRGVYLKLCYFEPNQNLNPEHLQLCESNQFTVVRQLHYSTQNENSIDMALFLNGIPIVTMELKNQFTGQNIENSEFQYKTHRDPREPLLKFKRCLAHFCVDNDQVSMTTQLKETQTTFLPYNQGIENPLDPSGGYRTEYLWKDILTPNSLLDIIENFVHVAKEKEAFYDEADERIKEKTKEILIFPRYHQWGLLSKFKQHIKEGGPGHNYLVQHTTGSGKSYSIGWLAHTLTSLYRHPEDTERMFDTVVVVTDRKVLDNQLRNTLLSLQKTQGVVGGVDADSAQLREFLEQGKSIVVTTIQKFPFISKKISSLGDRTFAVIIDEVHSSQSGELSKELKATLSGTDDDEDKFDYEDMLREEIKNRGQQKHISFFGFTGTPKGKTLELFGTKDKEGRFVPFHIYSMAQSIHEGFTLDVLQNYTTYKRWFKIRELKDGDVKIPIKEGTKELIRYVDSHPKTIEEKVRIIINHWMEKGSKEIAGRSRGMVVVESRKKCVQYFTEINHQLEAWKSSYRALVAFSGKVSVDGVPYTEAELNRSVGYGGYIPSGLKNPKYRLLVVANKFQTGFDEPLMQSMYVDKRLEGVQCVQTLSRLNRITQGKTRTFVLDFVNEPETIRDSFQQFYQSTMLESETDPNSLYDLKQKIDAFTLYTTKDVNSFCERFYDKSRSEGEFNFIIDRSVDLFKEIKNKEEQEDCRSKIQSFIRLYGYLSQIITFSDIELEKTSIFLKYLNKKLPKRENEKFNIANAVDLVSLRIQKSSEYMGKLKGENIAVPPLNVDPPEVRETEYDFLSKIIEQVNRIYGDGKLTERDKSILSKIKEGLTLDTELRKYMSGDNTGDMKRKLFEKHFEKQLISCAQDNPEFYNRMTDNHEMTDYILRMMYEAYLAIQYEK